MFLPFLTNDIWLQFPRVNKLSHISAFSLELSRDMTCLHCYGFTHHMCTVNPRKKFDISQRLKPPERGSKRRENYMRVLAGLCVPLFPHPPISYNFSDRYAAFVSLRGVALRRDDVAFQLTIKCTANCG